jgi:hypothetical protein
MASSHTQAKCEAWIVETWLPQRFGQRFSKKKLKMQGRGRFEFDAASEDGAIVGNISTATAHTHRGKVAAGKKSKIRADCLMLSLVDAKTKLLLLTESCMVDLATDELKQGRLPLDISILHVELPDELKQALILARAIASEEVQGSGDNSDTRDR